MENGVIIVFPERGDDYYNRYCAFQTARQILESQGYTVEEVEKHLLIKDETVRVISQKLLSKFSESELEIIRPVDLPDEVLREQIGHELNAVQTERPKQLRGGGKPASNSTMRRHRPAARRCGCYKGCP